VRAALVVRRGQEEAVHPFDEVLVVRTDDVGDELRLDAVGQPSRVEPVLELSAALVEHRAFAHATSFQAVPP